MLLVSRESHKEFIKLHVSMFHFHITFSSITHSTIWDSRVGFSDCVPGSSLKRRWKQKVVLEEVKHNDDVIKDELRPARSTALHTRQWIHDSEGCR